jgi:hypothetical protein
VHYFAAALRDDHSSSPGLAAGIEQPTRGFIFRGSLRHRDGSALAFASHSTSRASSPLLFGLAPRGVCHAPGITAEAVGSYPTFSPLPALRTIRRCPEGFPPGYHRAAHRWRYCLCGTFRGAVVPNHAPWRYQAHCPFSARAEWCPDFPPALPACAFQASDRPTHPPTPLYVRFRSTIRFVSTRK